MYSEKVQKFIDDLTTYQNKVVIDTMGVEYKIPSNEKVFVIRFTKQDRKTLYDILGDLKNCIVMFDRIDYWCVDYKSQEYIDIFTDLSNFAKKNNLIIFT